MSADWACRLRATNRLVRCCYEYLRDNKQVTPETIHALCRLTWITKSYDGASAGYVKSTKIPALSTIFGENYSTCSMDEIASDIAAKVKKPKQTINRWVKNDTGFTNFRSTYRNSALIWIDNNAKSIKSIVNKAYSSTGKAQPRKIIEIIEKLPKIQSPSGTYNASVNLLITPLVFSLDKTIKFPILNGNKHVDILLKELGVRNSGLLQQYDAMFDLIGKSGIKDAADLDVLATSNALGEFLGQNKSGAKLLGKKDRDLPIKDESDYLVLRKNLNVRARRVHNELTNKLREKYKGGAIIEGSKINNRYDALIKNYAKNEDLLIEVKSCTEVADVRMAIGQLYDYHRKLKNKKNTSMAVLLPNKPNDNVVSLLFYARVGLLYFDADKLIEKWW